MLYDIMESYKIKFGDILQRTNKKARLLQCFRTVRVPQCFGSVRFSLFHSIEGYSVIGNTNIFRRFPFRTYSNEFFSIYCTYK